MCSIASFIFEYKITKSNIFGELKIEFEIFWCMVMREKHEVWKDWLWVAHYRGVRLQEVYHNLLSGLVVVKSDEKDWTHDYLIKSSLFVG